MAKANLENARALYPSCNMGMEEWLAFFGSAEGVRAMGRVLYDIYDEVKTQEERNAGIRRIGRRPAREAVPLDEIFAVIFPVEFTNDPLPAALTKLLGKRSQRQFAAKVPVSQSYLSRILSGEREVDLEMIERLADAAEVKPWYFAEWRAQYLGQLITEVLMSAPHLGVTVLKEMRDSRRGHEASA